MKWLCDPTWCRLSLAGLVAIIVLSAIFALFATTAIRHFMSATQLDINAIVEETEVKS